MSAIDDEGPAALRLPPAAGAISLVRLLGASAPLPPATAPFDIAALTVQPEGQPKRAGAATRRRRVEDIVEPPPALLSEDPDQICAALETLARSTRRPRGWFDWSR